MNQPPTPPQGPPGGPWPPQQPHGSHWQPQQSFEPDTFRPQQWPPAGGGQDPSSGKKPPGKGLVVGIVAAAVAVLALVVVGIFTLRPAAKPAQQPVTPQSPGAGSTPTTGPTTPTGSADGRYSANSQFANGPVDGWDCDNNCSFEGGRLHISATIPADEESTDWWHTQTEGWAQGNVQKSTVTLEGVSFEGYGGESFVGIKCGSTVVNRELTDAFQVEVKADGTVQNYKLVGSEWESFGQPSTHNGDHLNPGDLTFTCEQTGEDFTVSVAAQGLDLSTTYRGVNRQGTTLLAYGGYGEPGTRVGFSTTGVRYEANE
ncbi:hypothetical protein [Granulicoccus sp. GXG6511]|uniref:hypothetical protein n=1 Tax=Granulicoccus sp. GXG6511 TaxID=3381351 RepID=UPI003D7D641D